MVLEKSKDFEGRRLLLDSCIFPGSRTINFLKRGLRAFVSLDSDFVLGDLDQLVRTLDVAKGYDVVLTPEVVIELDTRITVLNNRCNYVRGILMGDFQGNIHRKDLALLERRDIWGKGIDDVYSERFKELHLLTNLTRDVIDVFGSNGNEFEGSEDYKRLLDAAISFVERNGLETLRNDGSEKLGSMLHTDSKLVARAFMEGLRSCPVVVSRDRDIHKLTSYLTRDFMFLGLGEEFYSLGYNLPKSHWVSESY